MPHQDTEVVDSELVDVQTLSGQFADAFNKLLVTTNTVQLDLPSTYPATPERYKAFVNGTRTDIQNISQLTDTEISYRFDVAGGDRIRWQSRERPRYIPNYDSVFSAALRTLDGLQTGDALRVGQASENLDVANNTGTGWFWEFRGNEDPRFVIYAEGVNASRSYTDLGISTPFTNPVRLASQYNLYNVGPQTPSIYYTDKANNPDNPGVYEPQGGVSVDDGWAVNEFNLPVFAEMDIASGNTTKTFDIGTFSYAVLGDVQETRRSKWARDRNVEATASVSINSSDYTPFMAVRLDPEYEDVLVNFENFRLAADSPGEVVVKDFYPDQVTFINGNPNWQTPLQHTNVNTAVQWSFNVDQFEDTSGTLVNQTTMPAGFQVGFVSDGSGSGAGNNTQSDASNTQLKRPLYNDSIALMLKRNDPGIGVGSGGTFAFETSQTF